mgnify:CR=1 FL=1
MKKRILPICLSFLFSIAFLAVGIYFTYCFVKEPVRNFAILAIPPAFISAADYAALGALLCANKLSRTIAICIFAIALVAALGPLIFLSLLMFPAFFSELGLELALQLFVPVIPCALPLVMIFTAKDGKPEI